MSITFDGIVLPSGLVWEEHFISQDVEQTSRRTLGGAAVVFSAELGGGKAITLSSREVNGILIEPLKKSTVDELLDRAATPGAQYLLNIHGAEFSVIFRHEDPPAVDMAPIVAKWSYEVADLMRGQIKLLTV